MTSKEKSGQQDRGGMQVPGTRTARGRAPWKAETKAAVTKSPGLPTSPKRLRAFLHSHIQSLPSLRGPHTICNLFSPVSPSLCLLSDQFSINPKSFPASKQTSKQTPQPSSYYPIISPSRHRHTSPPPPQCTPAGLLPSKVH